MANRIVRSRFPSRGGSKRSTSWSICSVPTGLSNLAAATKAIAVQIPAATLLDLIPFTITRTIGVVHIETDQLAATEGQIGAFGMGVINDVASGAIASVPGPATDCGWGGWFVHQFFNQTWAFLSAIGTQELGQQYMFDSRAQRKVSAEEGIDFVVENFGSAGGLKFGVSFRMLIKAG